MSLGANLLSILYQVIFLLLLNRNLSVRRINNECRYIALDGETTNLNEFLPYSITHPTIR